jgi:hypothetical protein
MSGAVLPTLLALHVGVAVPATRVQERQPFCDFGAHSAALQNVAVQADPVFRQPGPSAKQALAAQRKRLLEGLPAPDLAALFAGPDGPALVRLALQERDPRTLEAVLSAAQPVARRHPRLAALALDHVLSPHVEVATAAVGLAFATGCDAPSLYALDGLAHPDERVQRAVLAHLAILLQNHRDIGLASRLCRWLEEGKAPVTSRVLALRLLASVGWMPAEPTLQGLSQSTEPAVAAEALVAWAVVAPDRARASAVKWLTDRRPVKRAAALRALAQAAPEEPTTAVAIARLAHDRHAGADPLAAATTVAEVAQQALAYIALERR